MKINTNHQWECFRAFGKGFNAVLNGKAEYRRLPFPNIFRKRLSTEEFRMEQELCQAFNNGVDLALHMAYGPAPKPIRM